MKKGKLVNIRGKGLYVEEYGSENEDAILYLHGGPGESCYDFSSAQAEKLAAQFRVIAIDQRGVCRSEGIQPGEPFGLNDIIEDCEVLRGHLNIAKWSLIGHSFGGFLSILYATRYPSSIHKIILEGPTFDFELTSRSLLRKTASLLEEQGKKAEAEKCLVLANTEEAVTIRELTEKYMKYSDLLGEERMRIYRYDLHAGVDYSAYSDDEWEAFYDNSDVHYDLLREEGKIFESLLSHFTLLPHDMLLLKGDCDPVPCDVQMKWYCSDAKNGSVYTFKDCGHTPHYEKPDEFTKVVSQFLRMKELSDVK
ncbi:alpha/beta fold hydrolase [Bacillus sp. AK031]